MGITLIGTRILLGKGGGMRVRASGAPENPTPIILSFSTPNSVVEGVDDVVFTVTLSNVGANDVTVDYATADGTALASTHYTAASGTLTIPAGQLTGTITVTVLNPIGYHGSTHFTLTLSNASHDGDSVTIVTATRTATILDDETNPDAGAVVPSVLATHPRLGVTASELTSLRSRIAANASLRSVLLALVQDSASDHFGTVGDTASKRRDIQNGVLNHAFLCLLDPEWIIAQGIATSGDFGTNVSATAVSLATQQGQADKAWDYLTTAYPDGTGNTTLSDVRDSVVYRSSLSDQTSQSTRAAHVVIAGSWVEAAVACFADWCYSQLSTTNRNTLRAAIKTRWEAEFGAVGANHVDVSATRINTSAEGYWLGNQVTACLPGMLMVVPFLNEDSASAWDQDVQQQMWVDTEALYLSSQVGKEIQSNNPYEGVFLHEGAPVGGGYWGDVSTPIWLFIAGLLRPALADQTDVSAWPAWEHYAEQIKDYIEPFSLGGTLTAPRHSDCTATQSDYNYADADAFGWFLSAGISHVMGFTNAAKIPRYYIDLAGREPSSLPGTSMWASKRVFPDLLWPWRDIAVETPSSAASARRIGSRVWLYHSNPTSENASQVVRHARAWRWSTGGHEDKRHQNFLINKCGRLALQPGNSKAGVFRSTSASGKHGANGLAFRVSDDSQVSTLDTGSMDSNAFEPTWPKPPFTSYKEVETLREVATDDYGYIGTRQLDSWYNTLDQFTTEFVYLRGGDAEWVIEFHRYKVKSAKTATTMPIWKVWVPVAPLRVTGTWTDEGAYGAFVYHRASTDATRVEILNAGGPYAGAGAPASPASHGRMVIYAVEPSSPTWRIKGGSDFTESGGPYIRNFQYAQDDNSYQNPTSTPPTAANIATAEQVLGWGRVEVRPATVDANEASMCVAMRFGDSDVMTDDATIVTLTDSQSKSRVLHLRDSAGERITSFVITEADRATSVTALGYTYTSQLATAEHVLTGLSPSATYYVSASADAGVVTIVVNTTSGTLSRAATSAGTLRFVCASNGSLS